MIVQKLPQTIMLLLFLALAGLVSSTPVDNQSNTGEIKAATEAQASGFLLPEMDRGENGLGWQVQEGHEHLQHQFGIVNNHRRKRQTGYTEKTWLNGDRYVGTMKDGMMHGHGTYTWSTGEKYVGSWANHKRNGQGINTWPNGWRYEGSWKDDKRHGHGTEIAPSGHKYVGSWVEGVKNGQGIYTWPSGAKYEGQVRDNLRDGWGKMRYSNGIVKEGQWSYDSFVDDSVTTGDITVPSGQIYYDNIVLNGNTLHVHGTMKGRTTGRGTVKAYDGARLDGDIDGQIGIIIIGHVKAGARLPGGNVNVQSGGTLDLSR